MSTLRPSGQRAGARFGRQNPSRAAVKASIAFQRPPGFEVFDSMAEQKRMLRLLGVVRGEVIAIPVRHDPEVLRELIRHYITELRVSEHKVSQAHSQTWAQAFERLHGEPL